MSGKNIRLEDILDGLRRQGFRITGLRRAVLAYLAEARKPLAAADIMRRLSGEGLSPHKTSIYRELDFLIGRGLINRVNFGERQDRFELSALEHHHHAVCERCGDVADVDCSSGIRKIEETLRSQQFTVRFHMLEFIGLCHKCQSRLE